MAEKERKERRRRASPWKGIYGVDRKFTARVDRLAERRVRPCNGLHADMVGWVCPSCGHVTTG